MLTSAQWHDLIDRVGPVMLFLVAITVVAEVADLAGVFDLAGRVAARLGRGRTLALWLLIVLLATLCTVVLSLDTTAVLLTPVVIAMARQCDLDPRPFAMTTLWLANTGSMLLPVSNLTNLLAQQRLERAGVGYGRFVGLTAVPAVVCVVATALVLLIVHRRGLSGRYALAGGDEPRDRVLLVVSGVVCVLLAPAFVSGVLPAIPAGVAAVLLLAVLAVRDRSLVRRIHVPWLMVLGVSVLFVVVEFARNHGLDTVLHHLAGSGSSGPSLFRLAGVGALSANAVNNLPAYLALEPAAGASAHRLVALLIGVNAGPLVTLWASLATLLWRTRCRRAGLEFRTRTLVLQGLVCAVVTVVAATGSLVLVG